MWRHWTPTPATWGQLGSQKGRLGTKPKSAALRTGVQKKTALVDGGKKGGEGRRRGVGVTDREAESHCVLNKEKKNQNRSRNVASHCAGTKGRQAGGKIGGIHALSEKRVLAAHTSRVVLRETAKFEGSKIRKENSLEVTSK